MEKDLDQRTQEVKDRDKEVCVREWKIVMAISSIFYAILVVSLLL